MKKIFIILLLSCIISKSNAQGYLQHSVRQADEMLKIKKADIYTAGIVQFADAGESEDVELTIKCGAHYLDETLFIVGFYSENGTLKLSFENWLGVFIGASQNCKLNSLTYRALTNMYDDTLLVDRSNNVNISSGYVKGEISTRDILNYLKNNNGYVRFYTKIPALEAIDIKVYCNDYPKPIITSKKKTRKKK